MPGLITPTTIVGFWKEAGPGKWYKKDPQFDFVVRESMRAAHFAAARRQLDDWIDTPEGALALMIVLDQYPRNSFRDTAHQFATDALGLMFAKKAFQLGHPTAFDAEMRQFFMTPFEHSEDLADHDALIPLIGDLPEVAKFAKIHRDIIVRFGRFPHRNACLGRETTAEEQAFLDGGGFAG